VLEECTTEDPRSVVNFFLGGKDSMRRILIKKCILFKVGSVCRVMQFTTASRNSLQDEEVETEVEKWLRQQSKGLLCRGFRRAGKAMGQVYQCWWRTCREINVYFQVWISHVLRFISISGLFTDSPSYIPNFIKIGSVIQKLIGCGYTDTQTAWWLHRLTLIFKIRKVC
jgi:hypothetical protein